MNRTEKNLLKNVATKIEQYERLCKKLQHGSQREVLSYLHGVLDGASMSCTTQEAEAWIFQARIDINEWFVKEAA